MSALAQAEPAIRLRTGGAAGLMDGAAGLVWATRGKRRVVFAFTISEGKITVIDMTANAGRLGRLNLEIIGD